MATKTKKVKEAVEPKMLNVGELQQISDNIESQQKVHHEQALKLAGAGEVIAELIKKVTNES